VKLDQKQLSQSGENHMKNIKLEEYRGVLSHQGLSVEEVERRMKLVEDFALFLTGFDIKDLTTAPTKEHVENFGWKLINEGRNTLENFSYVRAYTNWLGERKLYIALTEIMDCHNALGALADEIEKRYGSETRNWIFRVTIPALGSSEKERSTYTRIIMEGMAQKIDPQGVRDTWFQVQHGIPQASWFKGDVEDKEKFRQCGNIDAFLDFKRQERDAMLTQLHAEKKLWYTQEINDEVLAYIMSDPAMEVGLREGKKIYISKVPYNAVRYLRETDPKLKRYYACHCPLLRTAILDDLPISADVCNCSLGHASHYLAGLGLELKGEVLESAVKGDSRCRFVFYLPDEGMQ
jgi:hypothetical protein